MLPEFDKQWKAMGFTDKDLQSLQRGTKRCQELN